MADIVLVEDEDVLRRYLAATLQRMEHTVRAADTAEEGLRFIEQGQPDIVLSDCRLPGMTGLDLLATVKQSWPGVSVVLLTAYGTVEHAVAAMRAGANDYFRKPVHLRELELLIERCLDGRASRNGRDEGNRDRDGRNDSEREHPVGLLGESDGIRALRDLVGKLAAHEKRNGSGPTVLITGENGTGKGLIARGLHSAAPRCDAPFVEVDCSALPDHLLEAELLGYERGAFAGADKSKPGLFEAAAGGTIFLDEIGRMKLDLQAKIVNIIDARVLRRLGGTRDRMLRCSVVTSSHLDLEAMVQAGSFLPDLYHRINVFRICSPPLRERGDDVVLLAKHFLALHAGKYGVDPPRLTGRAVRALCEHSWPGNVRELAHAMERAVVLGQGETVDLEDLGLISS